MTTPMPCSRASAESRLRISARMLTSSMLTGSSAMRSEGRSASAAAMTMRCRCPPDSSNGYLPRYASAGDRPADVRASTTLERSSAREAAMRCTRRGSATISATVIRGLSDSYGSWKTICTRRRMRRRSRADRRPTSAPSSMTRPPLGAMSPMSRLPTVVFPEPDSPTSASTSPGPSSKLTPSTARTGRAGRRAITSPSERRPGKVLASASTRSSCSVMPGAPRDRAGSRRRGRRRPDTAAAR